MNSKKPDYFTEDELKCPCCGIYNINRYFLYLLNSAREDAGIPFSMNSCCRCEKHNKEVGGKDNSTHITTETNEGMAGDIKCKSSGNRLIILTSLIKVGFKRIGIAKTYIHADTDISQPQKVAWMY